MLLLWKRKFTMRASENIDSNETFDDFQELLQNIFAHQEYNITRNSMITCDWHHHNYAKFCIYHLVRNFKNLIQALWKCYKLKVKSRLLFEYNVNLPSTTIITVCNFKPTFSKIISLHLKSTKKCFYSTTFLNFEHEALDLELSGV